MTYDDAKEALLENLVAKLRATLTKEEHANVMASLWSAVEGRILAQIAVLCRSDSEARSQIEGEVAARLGSILPKWTPSKGPVEAYCAGVVKNVWREYRRSQAMAPREQAPSCHSAEEGEELDLMSFVHSLDQTPSRRASRAETVARLRESISKTTPRVKEVLEAMLTGMSQAEVGRALGIEPSEVSRRVERARGELRTLMGGSSRNEIPGHSSRPEDSTALRSRC